MSTSSYPTTIRLLNLCMILSGSLTIFGVISLNAGWLNPDSRLNSSSTIAVHSKQNDKPILEAATPAKNSANIEIFTEQEPSLLMPAYHLHDSRMQPAKDVVINT